MWTAQRDKDGYGRFSANDGRSPQFAHREALRLAGVCIPQGMVVDHVCRNRACVRKEHLRVTTPAGNTIADGSLAPAKLNRLKTHCPKGHPYFGDNLGLGPKGNRKCRACGAEYMRSKRAKLLEVQ